MPEETYSQWYNLPVDILTKIFEQHVEQQLETDFRRRLRAICSAWRSTVPLPCPRGLQFPLRVPNPAKDLALPSCDRSFLLFEDTYYLVSPLSSSSQPKGWLIRLQELSPSPNSGNRCRWRLLHPGSSSDSLFLSSPQITSEINNLLDYQVREVTRSYTLLNGQADKFGLREHDEKAWAKPFYKVVVLSNYQDRFTALALHCQGWIALWSLGDIKWTMLRIIPGTLNQQQSFIVEDYAFDGTIIEETTWRTATRFDMFDDISTHNGKFYAVPYSKPFDNTPVHVYEIDPVGVPNNTLGMGRVTTKYGTSVITEPPWPPLDKFDRLNLVLIGLKGELHCYVTYKAKTSELSWLCSVFVLKNGSWESVCSQETDVIFALEETTFSIPASHLGTGGGGWLCSRRDPPHYCFPTPSYTKGLEEVDSMVYPLYFMHFAKCEFQKPEANGTPRTTIKSFANLPDDEYTSIFFPPPPWIKWTCPARANAEVRLIELPFCKDRPLVWPEAATTSEYNVTTDEEGLTAFRELQSQMHS